MSRHPRDGDKQHQNKPLLAVELSAGDDRARKSSKVDCVLPGGETSGAAAASAAAAPAALVSRLPT